MRKIRENILVTSGNQGLYAANLDVFGADGKTLVPAGQIVVWNPKTNKSLANTVTCAVTDQVVISVGMPDGSLRSCFGDVMYGCDIQKMNAQGPSCGAQDIWDIYLDSSMPCNNQFSFTIEVADDDTRNGYPWNKNERYVVTVDTKDCECANCATGFDGFKLACKIVDAINNGNYNNLSRDRKAIFKNIPPLSKDKFTAHLLYGGANTNQVFCINPVVGSDCEKCIEGDVLIASMQFDTDTVVNFSAATMNAAGDATLIEKLQKLADEITAGLAGKGSAAISAGTDVGCCPWRLEINSCYADLQLFPEADAGGVALTPCTAANDPFDPVTVAELCETCAGSATPLTFTNGVRIIGSAIKVPNYTNSDIPNPLHGNLYRKIKVFLNKGFGCNNSFAIHTQEAAMPENLGYHFQWKEYTSDNGGRGRGHRPFVWPGFGPLNLPLRGGRQDSVITKGHESYCSYAIEHSIPYRDQTVYGNQVHPRGTTVVLIPSGDTVTRTAFETILNTYVTSCDCPIKSAVSCA